MFGLESLKELSTRKLPSSSYTFTSTAAKKLQDFLEAFYFSKIELTVLLDLLHLITAVCC